MEEKMSAASADRVIAVPAITPDAGHLKSGLIEHHIVCLFGVGSGIVSRHRDVDRIIKRKGCVNEAPVKVSVSAVAGVVIPACDRTGANPAVVEREACPADGLVGPVASSGDGHISANRGIAVPAVTPDAGHLKRGLIEHHTVRLIGVGTGIVSRHRNVDRGIDRDRSMHHCSEEGAIATIAGAVVTAGDRVRAEDPNAPTLPPNAALPIAAITAHSRDLGRGLIKIRECSSDRRRLSHGSRPAPR
jgi:hypothetical protein